MTQEQPNREPGHRTDAEHFDAHEGAAPHLDPETEKQFLDRLARGATNRRMQRKDPGRFPRNITAVLERGLQYVLSCHPHPVTFLYGQPVKVNRPEAEYLARQCDAITFADPETSSRTKRFLGKFAFKGEDGNPIDFPVPQDQHLGDGHLTPVERAMIARRNRGRRAV